MKIAIALGGNALGDTPEEQLKNVELPAIEITKLIKAGHDVIIGHGNGPQVGAIFNAFNVAHKEDKKIPIMPFAEAGAMSQGYIGYHIKSAIVNELIKAGISKDVLYFITQTIVDKNDPAFKNPTKPVGAFYKTLKEAQQHSAEGSTIIEIPNKGFRRVVPSPMPITLMSMESIQRMFKEKKIIICGGGGGIPTIMDKGKYVGVDGVIDKDYTMSMVATQTDCDIFVILTNVPNVCINYGTQNEKKLEKIKISEIKYYIETHQFGSGSMLPKVDAAVKFVTSGKNRKAIIAQLVDLAKAIEGKAGTEIVAE